MIPILQNTMKNKLGITYDTVRTAKYSAFGTPFFDFSPEEQKMIQSRIDETYEDFLHKVGTGRKMTRDQVNEIAQGRVWAGAKAKSIGLVDDMGGLDRAVRAAASLAHLEKYRTTDFPRGQTAIEQFIEKITNKKAREVIGMYLLDTNVVSELRKLKPHGAVLAWLEAQDDTQLHLSSVTIGEIQAGIELTREQDEAKAAEIEGWLEQVAAAYNVLPMDAVAFRAWARLMHRKSDTVYEDAMIAATASIHGLTVVTRNVADFKAFGVPLLNPFKA